MRAHKVWFLVGLLIVAAAGPVCAQEAAWLERARPEIERVLGYPLPRVRIEEAGTPVDGDVERHLRMRFPHLDAAAFPAALADALAVNARAELAHCEDGVLRISADNAGRMASWHA